MGRLGPIVSWSVACCALLAAGGLAGRSLQPVRVAGASMAPALLPGDLVLVARQAPVRLSDIVLIREPGHDSVLHRVVASAEDGSWITRGDANAVPDLRPVERTSVAGRVVAVLGVGRVVRRWRREVSGATLANQSDSTR